MSTEGRQFYTTGDLQKITFYKHLYDKHLNSFSAAPFSSCAVLHLRSFLCCAISQLYYSQLCNFHLYRQHLCHFRGGLFFISKGMLQKTLYFFRVYFTIKTSERRSQKIQPLNPQISKPILASYLLEMPQKQTK